MRERGLVPQEMLKYSKSCEGAEDLQEALSSILGILKAVNDSMHLIAITGYDVRASPSRHRACRRSAPWVPSGARNMRVLAYRLHWGASGAHRARQPSHLLGARQLRGLEGHGTGRGLGARVL